MKVFISWSGSISNEVAKVFANWLPCVLQSVGTFVSSEDIQKGAAWLDELNDALRSCCVGIVVLTKENIDAQWINFEAGAISSALGRRKLCPFLFNLNR
jgi:TIR domain